MGLRDFQGFTLLELILVIGLIVLLTVVAIPNFRPLLSDAQLEQSVQLLQADLMKTRQMAIKEDQKRSRVEFIIPSRYEIQIENDSNEFELMATKRLAAGCSFDLLPSENKVFFNHDGSANGCLTISIVNKGSTGWLTVDETTGRVEVSYN